MLSEAYSEHCQTGIAWEALENIVNSNTIDLNNMIINK